MSSEAFSLRLPKETKNKLEILAKSTGRTKSFLAIDAINEYCDLQSWQIEEIKAGLEQIEKGEVVSHKEIIKEWENKLGNYLV